MRLRLLGQVTLETHSTLIDVDSETTEVHINRSGNTIWVTGSDGYTILRVSKINKLILTDERPPNES
jgi:hypothetical protein